jgi:hypothetical protein
MINRDDLPHLIVSLVALIGCGYLYLPGAGTAGRLIVLLVPFDHALPVLTGNGVRRRIRRGDAATASCQERTEHPQARIARTAWRGELISDEPLRGI